MKKAQETENADRGRHAPDGGEQVHDSDRRSDSDGQGSGAAMRQGISGRQFEPLSYAVIGACIDVQRQLGVHCMEVDYQRSLAFALSKRNLASEREAVIPIAYDGIVVAKRRVDFRVWNDSGELLLETKACSVILPEDQEACLLYLRQGNYRLCLLVNFGQKPLGIERYVYTPSDRCP